ncbi:MAG TPA: aminotransferase class III-fold pyridoxal phosphate-dependent enzyme [Actinomycetota bacterium]|nr:aminotransferase class III-fold pyridoxal phosphate-dependent enzyme [Actinomycetota bacterium]
MSHVFSRATPDLPTAVSAEGVWITDADGTRYLDGAGGAIVVNVGHGVPSVIDAIAEQLARTQYVHPTAFTTEAVEAYAEEVAAILPIEDARVYPVSGGSEAVETALKMARAYHVAKGQAGRSIVIGRRASYHGNTIGALDASGKVPLRKPYTPWLGRFLHVSAAYELRCENPRHPHGCADWHAAELEKLIGSYGEDTIAAFIAEPIAGATLGAAVPDEGYWAAITAVCRAHDVLVIADEVMTGFGRTGAWFGVEHWDVQPDLLTAGKGTTSGYVPFGFAAASGRVHEAITEGTGFVHGFTWSHHALGAAAGLAVLRELKAGLVDRSRELGQRLRSDLAAQLADATTVADVRGLGLMIGIELVRDRETLEPFARTARVAERVREAAREAGLLVYPSTGHVDGANGDLVMLGPPFCLSDDEAATLVERTVAAVRTVS